MSDYIKREDVIEAVCRYGTTLAVVRDAIKRVPSADVEERKRSKWYRYFVDVEDAPTQIQIFKCENCGYEGYYGTPYCPKCGAKMENGNE